MAEAFIAMLVDFGRALRAEGLAIGSGDVLTYCAALSPLDPTDLVDLYWAGRTTLTTRRDDIEVYDEVFRRFFLGSGAPADELLRLKVGDTAEAIFEVPATEPGEERTTEAALGLAASTVDVLRHKAFADCTEEELAALRRIMARIRLTPPRRRTRRTRPSDTGRSPDLRRTIRRSLRTHGEPISLYWRRRRARPRPLVLILDVSGSMADYSRALLQFAYSARQAARKVEVFCFGTRLTRITRQLRTRSPDDALRRAAGRVVDWDGGTRIGDSLTTFVRDWGRQGICRGGIVVICSDGLDRGDPETLATALERLNRLCRWVVWLNPHPGGALSLGMMVADPHIDVRLCAQDLSGLEQLAALLPTLR
jgi:uncharacterized protein with von Willebrand factor type A (vWA) domain